MIDYTKFDLEYYVGTKAERDNFKSVDGDAWFKCCFHDGDDTASLHVTNKQVYHCHGCGSSGGVLDFVKEINKMNTQDARNFIKEHLGEEVVTVELEKPKKKFYIPDDVESVYSYNDGYVLKYRMKDKKFIWANFDDGDWWVGIGNHDIKLYAPNGISGTVIIAEGEKDVDALISMGFTAVSSPNGANSWKDKFTQELKQADRVIILNDNDDNGIENAMKINKELLENGIKAKRVLPIQLNESDKKGYDIYDVVVDIGADLTKKLLQSYIDDDSGWDRVYWDSEILTGIEVIAEPKEIVEVEVVWESGLGEEYDMYINQAVQETIRDRMIGELTLAKLLELGKPFGQTKRDIQNRVKILVEERNKNQIVQIENKVMKLEDLKMEVDISGSGYVVEPQTTAILDERGSEVIGHFLSFIGIEVDAESEQDNDVKVALAYNTPQDLSNIRTMIIPKRELSTPQDIVKRLSGYNINVTSINANNVVGYLQDLQNHFNEKTVTLKSLKRFGWYNGKLMPYEQDGSGIVFDSTVAQPIANKLNITVGEREKSLQLIKEIARYSESTAVILGAAVGSLILSYINEGGNQSFALNVWNETSTGKSVTCQGVASIFGYPYKDKGWWADGNATQNKDIYHNALLGNLPTFIDDPARNRGLDSNAKRNYVFSVTSGEGRGRMGRSGDIPQDVREWCNVMIMTNETPFIDASIEDGGARARCLEVAFDKPLDIDTVERWIQLMGDNYGHFAVEIADHIRGVGKETLNKNLRSNTRWFNQHGVDGKRAVNASIIMMGLMEADAALGLDAIDPKNWLVKQIRGSGALSDGERAYIKLMRIIETNIEVYRGMEEFGVFVGSLGYASNGTRVVNLPYTTIEKYGKEHNFNTDSLIHWAYAKGKMISNYDENDKPKPIRITNERNTIRVLQVIYPWDGKQTTNEVKNLEYYTIEEREVIDV